MATDPGLQGWDGLPTKAGLEEVITTLAPPLVGPNRALTLYLVDHGDREQFYLDKPLGEWVRPEELDEWRKERIQKQRAKARQKYKCKKCGRLLGSKAALTNHLKICDSTATLTKSAVVR